MVTPPDVFAIQLQLVRDATGKINELEGGSDYDPDQVRELRTALRQTMSAVWSMLAMLDTAGRGPATLMIGPDGVKPA